jgi:hypothetical protein
MVYIYLKNKTCCLVHFSVAIYLAPKENEPMLEEKSFTWHINPPSVGEIVIVFFRDNWVCYSYKAH